MPKINGVICKQASADVMIIERGDAAFNTPAKVYGAVAAVGTEAIIWEATVPAQEAWSWGVGSPVFSDNQGRMFFFLLDKTTVFNIGILRIGSDNNSYTDPKFALTINDSALHATDVTSEITATPTRENQYPLPEDVRTTRGFSSRLQLKYNAVSVGTEDAAGFQIPFTRYILG